MLGLNTSERIGIDYGGGKDFENAPFEGHPGPKIWLSDLGEESDKILYLYPEHLKLLYERFKAANPKGVIFGAQDFFDDYAPAGYSKKELDRLEEERKIFVDLFKTDASKGYPHARKYLPELFEPETIGTMAADPWLNVDLLGEAEKEGKVPLARGESSRWSLEWRAYCDRLLASGQYK
jgi:hypothetical protein